MSKVVDLTGQKFGTLTVIERAGSDKRGLALWLCQCDCGNTCVVKGSNLRNGNTTSCGCKKIEHAKKLANSHKGKVAHNRVDLLGEKFGRLTVVEYVGHSKWLCKCECGNEKIIHGNSLKKGVTQSCGCLNREKGHERCGELNSNYKTSITDEEREARRFKPKNREWNNQIKENADYTCDICGQRGGKLHSHHLDAYNWCKKRRYDIANGVCLCEHCHNDFHHHYGYSNTEEDYLEYKYTYENNGGDES